MAAGLGGLHRDDFYAWAMGQAEQLRRLADTRPNLPLDFPNLIDEVEGLALSDANTVRSQLERVMRHLLKLEHSPAPEPRRQWLNSVDDARAELERHGTPTIHALVEPELPKLYARARRSCARDLLDYGEREAAAALPAENPYPLDRLLDEGWYPASRRGLVDEAI